MKNTYPKNNLAEKTLKKFSVRTDGFLDKHHNPCSYFRDSLVVLLWNSPPAGQPTLPVFWSHAQFRTGLKFTYGEREEGGGSLEFGGEGREALLA